MQISKEGSTVQFQDHHRQMPVPFVIYPDFEALTEKASGCQPNSDQSYTHKYQQHTACSYGYNVVCCHDDEYSKPVRIYRDEEPVNKFIHEMLNKVEYCNDVMKRQFNKPLVMSDDEEEMFKAAEVCHICGEQYKETDVRVRDHCHVTGKWRVSAHQECNLKLRLNPNKVKIPVMFHNLRGCDAHFIMQGIGKIGKERNSGINCIPNNMERYMAFVLGNHLVFLDNFQFMSSSLDKLAENLPHDKYKYTSEVLKNEQLTLMKRKGVYPYDLWIVFKTLITKSCPQKMSSLVLEGISDEQYPHAQQVWDIFQMKSLGKYYYLYLKSDVLLLADVL